MTEWSTRPTSGEAIAALPGGAEYLSGLRLWRQSVNLAAFVPFAIMALALGLSCVVAAAVGSILPQSGRYLWPNLTTVLVVGPLHVIWAWPAWVFVRAVPGLVAVPESTGERPLTSTLCNVMRGTAVLVAAVPVAFHPMSSAVGWDGIGMFVGVSVGVSAAVWCSATAMLARSTMRVAKAMGLAAVVTLLQASARFHLMAACGVPTALLLLGFVAPALAPDHRIGVAAISYIALLFGLLGLVLGMGYLSAGLRTFAPENPPAEPKLPVAYRVGDKPDDGSKQAEG